MNVEFPRLLTLLRKERGISQKKAAEALGISQALLSHYEKGIRECGLDFLARAADYYEVSCDYLLGRSSSRQVSTVVPVDIADNAENDKRFRGSIFATLGKTLSINSLTVLFDTLNESGMKDFANEAQKYVALTIYKLFRYFYSANKENKPDFFSVDGEGFPEEINARMYLTEAKLKRAAVKAAKEGTAPAVTYGMLQEKFPKQAAALLNVIKSAESDK